MVSGFQRAYPSATPAPGPAYWLPFRGSQLLVKKRELGASLILATAEDMASNQPQNTLYIGTLDGMACLTCEVDERLPLSEDWHAYDLRFLFGLVDETAYSVAGYAAQILHWQRTSRHCPVCGSVNGPLGESWGRTCPQCGHTGYPPVIPAVLVLVHDGEHILLSHKPGWGSRYSVFAGFVEPGESLEGCVARELAEEASIEVAEITYYASQTWPFPSQLMVGFQAHYIGGEPTADLQELDDVKWFHIDALPNIPPPLSLSYQLVQAWVRSLRPQLEMGQ
ncbi:MAG TPA: NAD(+) diphosphatase [Ktedonobacteraceae bacterium]